LRNALYANKADLVKDYKGMNTLKEAFMRNVKTIPNKEFLGTRQKNKKEDGTVELGAY
jgi:hypothetical protein